MVDRMVDNLKRLSDNIYKTEGRVMSEEDHKHLEMVVNRLRSFIDAEVRYQEMGKRMLNDMERELAAQREKHSRLRPEEQDNEGLAPAEAHLKFEARLELYWRPTVILERTIKEYRARLESASGVLSSMQENLRIHEKELGTAQIEE